MPKLGNSDSATAQHLLELKMMTDKLEGSPELQEVMRNGYKANPKKFTEFAKAIRNYEKEKGFLLRPDQMEDFITFAVIAADNPDVDASTIMKNVLDPSLDLADFQTYANLTEDVRGISTGSSGAFGYTIDPRLMAAPDTQMMNQQTNQLDSRILELANKRINSAEHKTLITSPKGNDEDFNRRRGIAIRLETEVRNPLPTTKDFLRTQFGQQAVSELLQSDSGEMLGAVEFNPVFKSIWETIYNTEDNPRLLGEVGMPSMEAIRFHKEELRNGVPNARQNFDRVYGPGASRRVTGYR